ncbi:MAG TPA: hypothetical protein VGS41_07540, partial [Chthonomonadales bacterium]|nr:hypothetical protein [Chthonomonadales bacterium]
PSNPSEFQRLSMAEISARALRGAIEASAGSIPVINIWAWDRRNVELLSRELRSTTARAGARPAPAR